MFRVCCFAIVVVVVTAALFSSNQLESQEAPVALAGALPTIYASQYASLQAALDALPETGGLVQLPAGTFEIDEPLRIRVGDVCLVGAGTATHIRNRNQEGQAALILAHPESSLGGQDRKRELWRIRLANFRLTGNEQSGAGIAAYGINEIFVDGVTVSNHGSDGILLDHCYEDPRVSDCLITYNAGTGLNLLGCHDIVVAANQFEENQDGVHCFDGFNLCMTGNCLDDHLGRGVVIENTYGSVLSGNMIEECAADAVVLDRDCYGIAISANVIAHNGAGVDLQDAHGCAVSANALTIMQSRALRVGPDSGRIAFSGNSVSNSYIGSGQVRRGTDDQEAAGVVLERTREIGIAGNVFSGLRPKALAQVDSKSVLFESNLVVDSGETTEDAEGTESP